MAILQFLQHAESHCFPFPIKGFVSQPVKYFSYASQASPKDLVTELPLLLLLDLKSRKPFPSNLQKAILQQLLSLPALPITISIVFV